MEKNMSGIQPQSLTDSELERFAYINQDKLPPNWTAEILKRFVELEVKTTTPAPSQLSLF
jgi:hypothetical protein